MGQNGKKKWEVSLLRGRLTEGTSYYRPRKLHKIHKSHALGI